MFININACLCERAISAIMMIVLTLGGISTPIASATRAAEAASLFFAILDAPVPQMKGAKAPEISAQDDIVFEKVNFRYPTRPYVQVLSNLTVEFACGKTTAIVGESGSGKSTIVGLIERWYDVGNLPYITNVSNHIRESENIYIQGCEALTSSHSPDSSLLVAEI